MLHRESSRDAEERPRRDERRTGRPIASGPSPSSMRRPARANFVASSCAAFVAAGARARAVDATVLGARTARDSHLTAERLPCAEYPDRGVALRDATFLGERLQGDAVDL